MSNPEEIDNSYGYEQTDQLSSSGYLLHKETDLIEKDDIKIERRYIYYVISDVYFREDEILLKHSFYIVKNMLIPNKIFHQKLKTR